MILFSYEGLWENGSWTEDGEIIRNEGSENETREEFDPEKSYLNKTEAQKNSTFDLRVDIFPYFLGSVQNIFEFKKLVGRKLQKMLQGEEFQVPERRELSKAEEASDEKDKGSPYHSLNDLFFFEKLEVGLYKIDSEMSLSKELRKKRSAIRENLCKKQKKIENL